MPTARQRAQREFAHISSSRPLPRRCGRVGVHQYVYVHIPLSSGIRHGSVTVERVGPFRSFYAKARGAVVEERSTSHGTIGSLGGACAPATRATRTFTASIPTASKS